MLVDARFILFIPVELLLVGFHAGFMPQWPQLLHTAERADLTPISPSKTQTQPWQWQAPVIGSNARQSVTLMRVTAAQTVPPASRIRAR
jgi:hypothetical protein